MAGTTAAIAHVTLSQRAAEYGLQHCGIRHFASPLKSTGAILAANLPAMLVCVGTVASTGSVALADSAKVPLQHVQNQEGAITWLGIMAGMNDGSPRLYMFDTGSDQFNAQFAPDTTGVKPVPGAEPEFYPYDDGSTGNWVRRVQFESLSYYDPADTSASVATFGGKYKAGKVLDILFTDDHRKDRRLSDEPVFTDENGTKFYGDPKPNAEKHANEIGQISVSPQEEWVEIPNAGGQAHISGTKVDLQTLKWVEGDVKVNVNVVSARKSSSDNLLRCDFIDGPLSKVQKQPVTLHCALIEENYDTELKP
jgi:hypothetical protein